MEEAEVVKGILSTNWNAANTGNVTPVIDVIYNRADIDARKADFVLTYNTGAGIITHSGVKTFNHQNTVSVDMRCVVQSRFKLHVKEVKRIIEGKYLNPSSTFHRLFLVRDNDLSDRMRGLYRRVIDVIITKDLLEVTAI